MAKLRDEPRPSAAQHERARWWREHVVKLSRPALSELTGYSVTAIVAIERGDTPETSMQRYRLACAAIALGVAFDWKHCSLDLPNGAHVTLMPPDTH
jgi:hypothetical protein